MKAKILEELIVTLVVIGIMAVCLLIGGGCTHTAQLTYEPYRIIVCPDNTTTCSQSIESFESIKECNEVLDEATKWNPNILYICVKE